MEYNIINTGDYLIIVDESEIKDNDIFYDNGNVIDTTYVKVVHTEYAKKIISHLPLNNSPILEGVILLPPLEDEVEKLAQQEFDRPYIVDMGTDITPAYQQGFVVGYNKAKEKYKYTEENLKDIWEYVKNNRVTYKEYLQSLQQPKIPVGFKKSVEILNVSLNEKNISFPAKTTNSQGITQWVGEYIY